MLVTLAACWPAYSAPRPQELEHWLDQELVPYVADQLSTHPRFRNETLQFVVMQDSNPQPVTSALALALRDRLQDGLVREIEDLVVNGDVDDRLPHNLSVSVPYVDGEALLLSLEDVAVSSGSACRSSAPGGSHVMKAIGRDDDLARSTIRFGLGRWTTEEEIDYAIGRVTETVARLRSMTSMA